MTIGIGGAGSKLAAKLDRKATLVNVSETELNKVDCEGERILASIGSEHGLFQGSRKNREIGHEAYISRRRELLQLVKGNKVFCSSGGGTGNGITTGILEDLGKIEEVPLAERTFFGIILPYARLETNEFVSNTVKFLQGPLAEAIDKGYTGNIVLFSNKKKFESQIAEDKYNEMMAESLKVFLAIPQKNTEMKLLDGHIDPEDFALYLSRPFINHFTYFTYNPQDDFGKQLEASQNELLLPPEEPIEAMFLLEVPKGGDCTIHYKIVEYFVGKDVTPVYSVVENPDIDEPFVTVSLLYSRKPMELVEDFNRITEEHAQAKVKKSIEQYVTMPVLEVNMENEAKKIAKKRGDVKDEVLETLRRIGKL